MTCPFGLTALWGGQAGCLLIWSWLMSGNAGAAMLRRWDGDRSLMTLFTGMIWYRLHLADHEQGMEELRARVASVKRTLTATANPTWPFSHSSLLPIRPSMSSRASSPSSVCPFYFLPASSIAPAP